ncbi:hypothetical protein HID58_069715 [Brassica napus]|uniref:DNL-type domain-containing protein n=1 Tax=Brassica napus TaxID=3708 RepID=A0ABQ7YWU4_BRANA|nr:hypothetical protein HID58_069715 [Brassica napus]
MLKLHGCRKLKLKLVIGNLKDDNHSLAVSYTSSSSQVPKLRTVPMIEEGPREQRNQLFSVLGSLTDPEEEESKDSSEVNSMRSLLFDADIKLPRRRSLQVEFSCNSCGEITKRLINRLAYERGIVFVQCGGCLKHHKLAVIASRRRVPSTVLSHIATLPSSWFKAFPPFYVSWESVRTGRDGRLGGVGAGGADAGVRVIGAGFVVVVEASCWADNWCNLWSCGGETVGVTAGGGVVGDAGGGVAETGGTTVVGVVA